MTEYTPTTEEVRADASRSIRGDWFDRWLAEHDRQVAERAWDEAIEHVDKTLGGEYSAGIRLHQPYRKGQS